MSVYENLDLLIRENIKQNGRQEITGQLLRETLLEMVEILGQPEDVLWLELYALRNTKTLIPGRLYRITDYITTTTQSGTQSAGHPFDVIVLALSVSKLSEQAWAVQSARDTDGYFANSKLSAWQIWYSLDNDTERFAWADATNGKGVIYRMIDEHNNDCPYDFKNIRFRHPNDTVTYPDYYFTFTNLIGDVISDKSLIQGYCYGNTIREYIISKLQKLNCVIFINNSITNSCNSNSFGNSCYSNSFGNSCSYNSFGNSCSDNSFGNSCSDNSFGNYCSYNSFGNYCSYNSFRSSNTYEFDWDYEANMPNGALLNYIRNNHFGDNCSLVLVHTETLSSSKYLQNLDIAQGLKSTETEYSEAFEDDVTVPLFVTIAASGQDYEIKVARNTSGDVKVFTLADIIA